MTSAPASRMATSSSPVPTPKCTRGTPRSATAGEHRRGMRRDERGVVGQRQRARPGVEQLHRRRAGQCLGAQERRRSRRPPSRPAHARSPGRRASGPWSAGARGSARPRPGRTPAVNGAPANPISGVDAERGAVAAAASMIGASAAGSSGGSAATSAAVRIGWATTGPVPGTISTSIPASFSGTTMSLNRIAASTRCRRTGCRVISVARSGVRQASSIPVRAAHRPVLGQRPARLPHEPHRAGGRPLAAVGGEQRGVGGAAVAQRVGRRQARPRRVGDGGGGGGGGDGHGRSMVSPLRAAGRVVADGES